MAARAFKAAVAVLFFAVVVVVVLVLVAPQVLGTDALAERGKQRVLQLASERLGRDVTAGRAHVELLPLQVAIEDVKIAGARGNPPLLEKGLIEASLRLWPVISSRGRDVDISAVTLRSPQVNLVRDEKGGWAVSGPARGKEQVRAKPAGASTRVTIDRLRIEDAHVRIIDRAQDTTVELGALSVEANDLARNAPIAIELDAALGSNAPNIHVELTAVTTPGGQPRVDGTVTVDDAPLSAVAGLMPASAAELVGNGRMTFTGTVRSDEDGARNVSGDGKLIGLDLRGSEAAAQFHLHAALPTSGGAPNILFKPLSVQGPGTNLTGEVKVHGKPVKVEFALEGPELDVDRLVATTKDAPATPKATKSAKKMDSKSKHQVLAEGTLKLGRLVRGPLLATDVDAHAVLTRGTLELRKASGHIYGGQTSLDGSRVDFSGAEPRWLLRLKMHEAELAQAMDAIAGAVPVAGRADATIELEGEGTQWSAIRNAVSGAAVLTLHDALLANADLQRATADILVTALQAAGLKPVAKAVEEAGTKLGTVNARMEIEDGWMKLRAPLKLSTPWGKGELSGRIGLDRRLELTGELQLEGESLARLTGGVLKPAKSLTIPVRIEGTLTSPRIAPVDPERIAAAIAEAVIPDVARGVTEQVGKQLGDTAKEQMGRALRGVFGK